MARENGTIQRQRKFKITETIASLLVYCGNNLNSNNQTFTLKGFHQALAEMSDITMSSKALHNRLRTEEFLDIVMQAVQRLAACVIKDVNKTGLKLLDVYKESIGVKDIIMLDGSEISLRYSAYDNFDCKAKTRNPDKTNPDKKSAAIKLHTGFSVVNNMPTHIDITEAVANEREHLSPDIYDTILYLCDRGYVSEALYLDARKTVPIR